jgi:hypothetical protein
MLNKRHNNYNSTNNHTKSTKSFKFDNDNTKQSEQFEQSDEHNSRKSVRKPGRTILVKSSDNSSIDGTLFDAFEGLVNKAETKSSTSLFLTFDNINNTVKAYNKLRSEFSMFHIRFSYYRIFFTMEGLTDSTDYNLVKKQLMDYVTEQTSANVLYCRLYRKDDKFLGCGDFTVDTLNSMNMLLSREGNLKEYTLGPLKGTFYRYNNNKNKNQQTTDTN